MLDLVKRVLVTALIGACLGVVLASPAQAAVYKTTNGTTNIAVNSLACVDVASAWIQYFQRTTDLVVGLNTYFFFTGDCTGQLRVVGDSMTFARGYYTSGAVHEDAVGISLASVQDDQTVDDVGAVSLQRVVVLCASLACFFLGAILGRA